MLIDFSNLQARAIDTTPIRHDIIPFSPSGLIVSTHRVGFLPAVSA